MSAQKYDDGAGRYGNNDNSEYNVTSFEQPPTTYRSTLYENRAFEADGEPPFTTETSGAFGRGFSSDEAENGCSAIDADPSGNRERSIACREEDDQEDDGSHQGACLAWIQKVQQSMQDVSSKHTATIKMTFGAMAVVAYAIYFGYAMSRGLDSEDQIRLLWITCFAVFLCVVTFLRATCGDATNRKVIGPLSGFILARSKLFKWLFIAAVVLGITVFIIVDIAIQRPGNLLSLFGFALYILLLFLFSSNPGKVRWQPVCSGLGIQFVFALLILRTPWGFQAFQWLGMRVSEFLVHADAGSEFVFGEDFRDHLFAFQVMPVVIFFSTVISVLYYLGVMQLVILKMAWIMQRTLGTTAAESVNAAGNIFIGQTEAPLLIRPLIDGMTPSELHAVMTGGFATIAGAVMASFILFGVEANHLITASVMAAPCALAMSKLSYPETTKSVEEHKDMTMEKPDQQNVIEAASAGASGAIGLVANIMANLIAFMALLAFVNATLQWAGERVGLTPPDYPPLTFQLICSYLLWPFAFVMGVDVSDCHKVAELIGFKVFINEFVAYTELGKLIENKKVFDAYIDEFDGPYKWVNGDIVLELTGKILIGGIISARSVVISTYALCGFANVSSIGMVMGALGSMSEKQKPVIARLALRAMITGNIVCFLNACTAGFDSQSAGYPDRQRPLHGRHRY